MSRTLSKLTEYMGLEDSGIYIFVNKLSNQFYVGKASNTIFERIKFHLYSSHNEKINSFVNNLNTALYIFPIDNKSIDWKEYDNLLCAIEYGTYRYLIKNGYESINSETGFSEEAKEYYNTNKDKINLEAMIKLTYLKENLEDLF